MAKKVGTKSFGTKLKQLREREGLSLETLGARAAIKPARITRLEADLELPPVAEIMRLAKALAVEPAAFLEEAPTSGRSRHAIATRTDDYAYELLSPDDQERHLMVFRVTIDPNAAHRKVGYQHEGEEFIYVLTGRLKITVNGKSKTLGPGESIQFDSGHRHHLLNPGKTPTVLVVSLYVP